MQKTQRIKNQQFNHPMVLKTLYIYVSIYIHVWYNWVYTFFCNLCILSNFFYLIKYFNHMLMALQ